LILVSSLVMKTLRDFEQARYMHFRRVPDDLGIEPKVMMHDNVAHSRDTRPIDREGCGADFIRKILRCLADNQEAEQHGLEVALIGAEALNRVTLQQAADPLTVLDDIVQKKPPVTGHESDLSPRETWPVV